MKKLLAVLLLLQISAVSASPALAAEDVYQSPDSFLAETFGGNAPPAKTHTVKGEMTDKLKRIMGSHYKLPQTKYWSKDGRTAWILEEIGKFEPITTGFVVGADGKMERIKVLIYRESHGWEVKHKFFTRQFKGAGLKRETRLDQRIDGIAGATLSVDALKRLSALALALHQDVMSSP